MPRGKKAIAPSSAKREASPTTSGEKPTKKAKGVAPPTTTTKVTPQRNTATGDVLVTGQGDVGQLGLGPDVFEKSRAVPVPGADNAVDVCAGGMHTLYLTASGEVYSFGCNDEGTLGRTTSSLDGTETTPGRVDLPEPVVQICAGDSHSAALTQSGVVHAWGNFRDTSGSMGLTPAGCPVPLPFKLLDKVVQISSGTDHLVMLRDDGTVYTVGCAEQGQLGRVPRYFSPRGGRRGIVYVLTPSRVQLPRLRGCKSKAVDRVFTGAYCTFVRLEETGAIYGFGLNNFHQLGVIVGGEEQAQFCPRLLTACLEHRWQKISGGQHHTLLMDNKGAVYSMGRKEYGRLGHGKDSTDEALPRRVETLPSCIDVASGNVVSLAVSADGKVYSWGMGTNGQLGHGDDEDVYEPKAMASKALSSRTALQVSGGGQHTVILATESQFV